MIINSKDDVTKAVLAEVARSEDPRLAEILAAFVRHMHAFVDEVRLTEDEYRAALNYVVELGQRTTGSHNEAVLVAGSLGLSSLVCLINNTSGNDVDTTANLLGPFWRSGAPATESGGSIVRSPTPGPALFATITVLDRDGSPVTGADVDVWQASPEGYYENQDPVQADMNLRGVFVTDDHGQFAFRSVLPSGYPIPVDGPAGALARALKRHNMRPAHIHFLVNKPGYKTQASQIYVPTDPHIDTDVQFGVTSRLLGDFVCHEDADAAPASDVDGPWYTLEHKLIVEAGVARLPVAPITGRAETGRPKIERLVRG